MDKIRVQVSSNFVLLRAGLASLLARSEHIECVGESGLGSEVTERACQVHPNVLVLDVPPDDSFTFKTIKDLKEKLPETEIIVLNEIEDRELALRLLRAGVKGYVSRRESLTELTRAVETVARGQVFLCPSASSALLNEYREQGRLRMTRGFSQKVF